jgi:radical SAM protein with 4Fe4S-binding SPASM domain
MQNEQITDYLLKGKRDPREEFMATLFEKCNLSCAFCWQNHDSTEGLNTVRSKVASLVKGAKASSKNVMLYNLMGGELFADEVFTDEMYQDYVYLITETDRQVRELGKTSEFTCCTNLVFSRPERVKKLLEELQNKGITVKITTSYDFTGRFNSQTLAVFRENVDYFKQDVLNIGLVLTAPNINEMLKDNDEDFKYFYNSGYKMFFDYYSPERNAATMTPSDALLLEAFYFLIDSYPNTYPVHDWIHNHNNGLSCKSSRMILPSGEITQCEKVPDKQVIKFFKNPKDMSNTAMETSFMEKMGCVTCEYFNRCSLGCFLQHYFKARDELPECVFKLTYDKITKNIVREDIYERLHARKLRVNRIHSQA